MIVSEEEPKEKFRGLKRERERERERQGVRQEVREKRW